MNLDGLHRKLIKVARANPPSDRVPYAFEKRIMASLKGHVVLDQWAVWARALWRATAPCIAIVLLLAVWSLVSPAVSALNPGSPAVDIAQDLENTVLAAAYQEPAADSFR
jgi:hypothetical protein